MGIAVLTGVDGIRRWVAAFVATVAAALAAAPPPAAAGEYVVAQCDAEHAGFAEAHFDRTDGAYYGWARSCGGDGRALRIENLAAAPVGAEGRIRFAAPAGTGITGVKVDASLRGDGGHKARLSFLDAAGNQAGRVGTGSDEPGGFERYGRQLDGVGRAGFAALLICAEQRPCPRSEQARTAIRNLRLTVRDRVAPSLAPSGTLLAPGWVRGARTLAIAASDTGSGVRSLETSVGGRPLRPAKRPTCATVGDGALVAAMSPCPRATSAGAILDTARPPFANGLNPVRLCARDYGTGANTTCVTRTVAVDNLTPSGAFRPQSEDDPELIAANLRDAHSGIAYSQISMRPAGGGAWRPLATRPVPGGVAARVDSSAVPPGRYAFRLVAVDRAGNASVIDRIAGGRPMVLELPLLEETGISARIAALGHRAPYGARPLLRGRLRTESGRGAAGLPLTVIERFEPGSAPRRRTRAIETGPGGAYRARLSAGPSRSVVVRFAGSKHLLASASRPRKLAVAGRVTMRLSRKRVPAGGRVRFRGRLGTAGARVPAPGKVVELQVREQGHRRFRTVGEALHSGRNGRVGTTYRFGRFYRSPARFAFRLKVTRQADWPYRAPTRSRPKRLTVVPRQGARG